MERSVTDTEHYGWQHTHTLSLLERSTTDTEHYGWQYKFIHSHCWEGVPLTLSTMSDNNTYTLTVGKECHWNWSLWLTIYVHTLTVEKKGVPLTLNTMADNTRIHSHCWKGVDTEHYEKDEINVPMALSVFRDGLSTMADSTCLYTLTVGKKECHWHWALRLTIHAYTLTAGK